MKGEGDLCKIASMRLVSLIFFSVVLVSLACAPAAAPVAIGNKPVSVNGKSTNEAKERATVELGEMSWAGFNGGVTKLKDLKGKAVILDFWATNCPPCIEEIPHLIQLKQQYGDDLVLVGLHVGDNEDRQQVPAFVEKLKITYPLADPDSALTDFIFQTNSAIPQTAVFDRNGAMVRKIVGFGPDIKIDLDKAVEQAVSSTIQN
jgi:thiol-disulfide isomerase/thioredoxin